LESASSADYRAAAIATIEREHRALLQVIDLLRRLTRDYVAGYAQPDFHLLSLALYYLDVFPGDVHHSREDEHLFPTLRRHGHDWDEALDALTSDHACDRESIAHLHRLLVLYQAGAPEALSRFREAVDCYAETLYEHMRREEALLAAAGDRLTDEEWRRISEAFAQNEDPLFGPQRRREFAALHHRIMNLLPRKLRRGTAPGTQS
jgi:hemerythrin-like domain-containing protein